MEVKCTFFRASSIIIAGRETTSKCSMETSSAFLIRHLYLAYFSLYTRNNAAEEPRMIFKEEVNPNRSNWEINIKCTH